jgi:hypothetical protein
MTSLNIFSRSLLVLGIFELLLVFFISNLKAQNCTNDTIPPVMICPATVRVKLTALDDPNDCYGPAGYQNSPTAIGINECKSVALVDASVFGGSSYDDCNLVFFTVARTQPYTDVIQNLNAIRGSAPCNTFWPSYPTEFERGISENYFIKFYCGEVGIMQHVRVRGYQVDADGVIMSNSDGTAIYSECLVNVELDTVFGAIKGRVFADTLANCTYDASEPSLENWKVKITGKVTGDQYDALTDSNGRYGVALNGLDTMVTVLLESANNFGQNCQSEYTVNLLEGETVVQDVPVHLEQRCNLLSVGIATPFLRRCFSNYYKVQACNLSNAIVPDAYVEVSLDDFFTYTGSTIPGTLVSGNTYAFQLGDLAAGECRTFNVNFTVSCNATLGATHCTEAHIYPYDDCRGGSSNWSGADVEVNATCDGDSVRFAITNVGDGAMTQLMEFVVVEDVVMRQEGSFQLGIGQTLNFSQPANGSTWRLEAQEEPLHPWGGPQAVALEGCGGLNNTGLVNIFPLSDPDPFEATACLENIGAYDPNDKQGIPKGYGSQHFIKANTDLEYLIRFQNTGSDTAFTVVIRDELTANLDPNTVRVEVASHPMEFALIEGNVLRFTFENILLPDSNVNWDASNGFVKFRVSQKPDLADGTILENSAAIYFDFNDPVITNTTLHTIGKDFVSVSTDDLTNDGLLRAYPNPASDAVFFDLKDLTNDGRFELTNGLGQQLIAENFTGNQFHFERKGLPAGIYLFQITSNNTKIATGKIVLK